MKCIRCGGSLTCYTTRQYHIQDKYITVRYKKCNECGLSYQTIEKLSEKEVIERGKEEG